MTPTETMFTLPAADLDVRRCMGVGNKQNHSSCIRYSSSLCSALPVFKRHIAEKSIMTEMLLVQPSRGGELG